MIDTDKITYKFLHLDEYLDLVNQVGSKGKEAFLTDKLLIGSAKYYLQVSIGVCLDVAGHIIASERLRAPKDYADSFSGTRLQDSEISYRIIWARKSNGVI
jgi:uncharacterized protein YutE (UPF0331/DUF86 family)